MLKDKTELVVDTSQEIVTIIIDEPDYAHLRDQINEKADKSEVTELQSVIDEEMSKKLEQSDLTPYAKKSEVTELQSAIDEEMSKKLEQSDLTPYAKKSDLDGYATENYVDTKFNSIDLSPYATKEELEDKADISYVDDKIAEIEIPSIDGLATEEYVDNKVNSIDLSEYATEQYVDSEISKIYVPSLDGYATEEYVDNKVSSIDLSEYALTSDLSSAIESINSDLDLKADKSELEGLATEDYVNEKIDEKEVGITEPELISKSVGSGKWMREGAHGIGIGLGSNLDQSLTANFNTGFSAKMGTTQAEGLPGRAYHHILTSKWNNNWAAQIALHIYNGRMFTRGSKADGTNFDSWLEVYTEGSAHADTNGVLHNHAKPLTTLNTSDMADTVVDNDLITVTSGAVYRAIKQLQDRVEELEAMLK